MKGVVYAKTGTKRDANSLSGYVLQNNGKAIAFSIMINGGTSNYQSYYELEDRILKLLVDNAD
jgi:D-alanyl-D-alanine carboxypeptidase|tara:strand:- start:392 stop:580 length:189 start_codon:yes stop_codon:yes gene_type:complete